MNQLQRLTGKAFFTVLATAATAAITATLTGPLMAQPRPAGAIKTGIDALDDDKVANELANRGMDSLLQFYFQKNNISVEKQQEKMVLIGLRSLNDKEFAKLPTSERQKKINDIVAGVEKILPTIKDPVPLLRYASLLIENGTQNLTDALELWGDNPKQQAALNPIAEAVDKILAQAADTAKAQGDTLIGSMKSPDDPRMKDWDKLESQRTLAVYNRGQAAYSLAISYDAAAKAKRAAVCKRAIESMADFLDPAAGVMMPTELAVAKLNMAQGAFAEAHKHFNIVIKAPVTDDPKFPSKYITLQYQARYFDLVCSMLEGKPDVAAAGLAELRTWQTASLPAALIKGVEAAASVLEYRIDATKADLAKDTATKDKFNGAGIAVLLDLVAKRPDLSFNVFEQVLTKLPDKPVMDKLDPLLLEAIMSRGIQAVRHKTIEKEDAHNIDLASDAAREIVKRRGKPMVSAEQVEQAAFDIGIFEQKLAADPSMAAQANDNKLDAVEAYLKYVTDFDSNKVRLEDALDNAISIILPMYKAKPEDSRTSALYDKALETALAKGRQEAAWPYALRLKDLGKFEKARNIFGKVKGGTPAVSIMAKYYQMYCDQQMLSGGDKPTANTLAVDPKVLTSEIQSLADETNALIDANLSKVPPAQKSQFQLVKIRTTLVAADAARANKNPQRVVDLLKDFEEQIKPMPPEQQNDLLGGALFLRVNALIALSKNDEAIKAIQTLVTRQSPQEALKTVTRLLTKLNDTYLLEKGKKTPDPEAIKLLTAQRAQLSGLLLQQVEKDPSNPNKKEYLIFNTEAQMQAVQNSTDPAEREKFLAAATQTYEALLKEDPEDAKLQRLLALAEYERGTPQSLKKAHDTLNRLFAEKRFGTEFIRLNDSDDSKPNEMYWEGLFKLLSAKVKLAQLNNDVEMRMDAERILKIKYIQFGDTMGGQGSMNAFTELRQQIIPWLETRHDSTDCGPHDIADRGEIGV